VWSTSRPGRFTPREKALVINKSLGGPQSRSGRGGEEKNSQPPPGIEPLNPDRPARSPALYRLSYHGSLTLTKTKGNTVHTAELKDEQFDTDAHAQEESENNMRTTAHFRIEDVTE
jgi:hypothetical protein